MPELPETMRAAVLQGPRRLEIEERPVPRPGPDDVVLRVSHCGVCGSDLHFVLDGWGRPGSVEGHEFTGTVVAVGPGVREWSVGDPAVGGPSARCGECEHCRAGRPSLCTGRMKVGEDAAPDGAFAEYVRMPARQLLALPDGLSLRAAALAEPMAVALHGITRAGGFDAGTRWLVTGAGPIGALSVAALRAHGVDDVVVSEPAPARRALAQRLSATVVEPSALVTPASPNETIDEPFDVALECSGHADAMEAALGQLDRAGTLVLVGAGMRPPRFDPNRILLNELTVTGSFTYDAGGFDAALALLASGRIPVDVLVEPDDVPLDGLLPAIEQLAAGERAGKVMIAP